MLLCSSPVVPRGGHGPRGGQQPAEARRDHRVFRLRAGRRPRRAERAPAGVARVDHLPAGEPGRRAPDGDGVARRRRLPPGPQQRRELPLRLRRRAAPRVRPGQPPGRRGGRHRLGPRGGLRGRARRRERVGEGAAASPAPAQGQRPGRRHQLDGFAARDARRPRRQRAGHLGPRERRAHLRPARGGGQRPGAPVAPRQPGPADHVRRAPPAGLAGRRLSAEAPRHGRAAGHAQARHALHLRGLRRRLRLRRHDDGRGAQVRHRPRRHPAAERPGPRAAHALDAAQKTKYKMLKMGHVEDTEESGH